MWGAIQLHPGAEAMSQYSCDNENVYLCNKDIFTLPATQAMLSADPAADGGAVTRR